MDLNGSRSHRGKLLRPHRAMRGGALSMWGVVPALFCFATACAEQSTYLASTTIEWRSACDGAVSTTYLRMDVSKNGAVRYDGALRNGKRWLRKQRIARADARSLVAGAKAATESASTLQASADSEWATAGCLVITVLGRAGTAAGSVLLHGGQALAFEKQVLKAVELEPQKCSSRGQLPKECGGVVLSFAHDEKQSCGRTHVTNVYASGTVHYYVNEIADSDRYAQISPAFIRVLEEHPVDAPLQEIAGIDNVRLYDGFYAELLRKRFESTTGIEWITFDETMKCGDPDYGPSSKITVVP